MAAGDGSSGERRVARSDPGKSMVTTVRPNPFKIERWQRDEKLRLPHFHSAAEPITMVVLLHHPQHRPSSPLPRPHSPSAVARIDTASGDFPQRIQIHDSSNCPMPASQHRPRSWQITPTSNSSSSVRSPLPNPSAPSAAPHSNRTIR
ncbi:hypothetical protein ACLOJK_029677 [Asimina triloba]